MVNNLDQPLLEEILNALETEDVLTEEFGYLSLHALSSVEAANCMKLRAKVKNKVMLILVDSGSSHSFVSADFVVQVGLSMQDVGTKKS